MANETGLFHHVRFDRTLAGLSKDRKQPSTSLNESPQVVDRAQEPQVVEHVQEMPQPVPEGSAQQPLPGADARLRAVGKSGPITSGNQIVIEGDFRNPDGRNAPPAYATVKIVEKLPSGKYAIVNEKSVMPTKEVDRLNLQTEIRAPTSGGPYEIHVWYKAQWMAKHEIHVQ